MPAKKREFDPPSRSETLKISISRDFEIPEKKKVKQTMKLNKSKKKKADHYDNSDENVNPDPLMNEEI